jgi:hypothetical protein
MRGVGWWNDCQTSKGRLAISVSKSTVPLAALPSGLDSIVYDVRIKSGIEVVGVADNGKEKKAGEASVCRRSEALRRGSL